LTSLLFVLFSERAVSVWS